MNLSKKSKVALFLLMITTSACFAQNWKSFVKGVEGRVGGKNNPQTKEQTKTNKTTESADTKKTTAKLSNNPQVQKRAAYLTKAEIALNSKDYTAATENYNKAVKNKTSVKRRQIRRRHTKDLGRRNLCKIAVPEYQNFY
ncbi:hypothetical protein [Treponema berlinense]|uniref:hypothetical protein n=1 Tax=Treponema berlinense TaxID=225004 RepID=UPI00235580AC|nr:hypothetical protein [Treponema berlinense]